MSKTEKSTGTRNMVQTFLDLLKAAATDGTHTDPNNLPAHLQ